MVEPTEQEDGTRRGILFVDDEPNILQGLRRTLRPMRHVWDMHFVTGGQEALQLLADIPCDVVVSDVRMPIMDGVQLLAAVRERFPQMVRILLSGQADRELIVRSATLAHQYLSKPCDAAMIRDCLSRVCSLRQLLTHVPLQRLVLCMQTLPSLPLLYDQVQAAVEAPEASIEQVGQYIERDIGMTAKVLQLVHSSFFGPSRHVLSPVEAIRHLGWNTVKTLVQSGRIFSSFDRERVQALSLDDLWEHSAMTGVCARRLACAVTCDQQLIDSAYLAGLLHDIGRLILATLMPEDYDKAQALARQQGTMGCDIEGVVWGTTQAAVGAYLLRLWGLPEPIVTAVALNRCPSAGATCTSHSLTAAHIVNTLRQEANAAAASVPIR